MRLRRINLWRTKTRLKWHLKNSKTQVHKNKTNNPKLQLIALVPSNDKKSLEKVKNGYIEGYSEKYGNKLLNKKSNPLNA